MRTGIEFLLLLVLSGRLMAAGRLDSFEGGFDGRNDKSKDEKRTESSSPHSAHYRDRDDEDDSFSDRLAESLAEMFLYIFAAGGAHANELAELREPGDPVLPVARVDAGYQWIDPGLEAFDYGAEVGYGFLALQARHTMFLEEAEDETLDFVQAHVLWRMGVTRRLEWDVGLGGAWLRGDTSNSSVSITSPVRYWPLEWMGVEVRPVWTSFEDVSLTDVDLSLVFRYKQATLRAGYRWLETESDVEGLSGWRVGVGWRF